MQIVCLVLSGKDYKESLTDLARRLFVRIQVKLLLSEEKVNLIVSTKKIFISLSKSSLLKWRRNFVVSGYNESRITNYLHHQDELDQPFEFQNVEY